MAKDEDNCSTTETIEFLSFTTLTKGKSDIYDIVSFISIYIRGSRREKVRLYDLPSGKAQPDMLSYTD